MISFWISVVPPKIDWTRLSQVRIARWLRDEEPDASLANGEL
jgi:hypothetical protein